MDRSPQQVTVDGQQYEAVSEGTQAILKTRRTARKNAGAQAAKLTSLVNQRYRIAEDPAIAKSGNIDGLALVGVC